MGDIYHACPHRQYLQCVSQFHGPMGAQNLLISGWSIHQEMQGAISAIRMAISYMEGRRVDCGGAWCHLGRGGQCLTQVRTSLRGGRETERRGKFSHFHFWNLLRKQCLEERSQSRRCRLASRLKQKQNSWKKCRYFGAATWCWCTQALSLCAASFFYSLDYIVCLNICYGVWVSTDHSSKQGGIIDGEGGRSGVFLSVRWHLYAAWHRGNTRLRRAPFSSHSLVLVYIASVQQSTSLIYHHHHHVCPTEDLRWCDGWPQRGDGWRNSYHHHDNHVNVQKRHADFQLQSRPREVIISLWLMVKF